jgi:hypothetical protein
VAERFGAVLVGAAAVGAGGLHPGVAEEFGNGDQVDPTADEAGRERVPEGVRGDLFVEIGVGGDGGDDVVRAFDRQSSAALVEVQGRVVGAGPVLALLEPGGERVAEL